MNLEEMGQVLRQERERQGMSLEKAAAEIRIGKKYLAALEEGRKSELPHPVYAKGFLKNYAKLLGLDPGLFVDTLEQFHAVQEDHLLDGPRYEVKDSSPTIRQGSAPTGFRPTWWLGVPLGMLVIALGWYFFLGGASHLFDIFSLLSSSSSLTSSDVTATSKSSSASNKSASQSSKTEPAVNKAENKPAPTEPAQPDAQPVQRDLLATTGGSAPKPLGDQPTPPAEPANPTEKIAWEGQFAAAGNQLMEITATQLCKLDVTDETGQNRVFTLLKGQRLDLRFNDKMSVRFVTAPAVAVKLNGKEYPLESGKAEGRTIQFP